MFTLFSTTNATFTYVGLVRQCPGLLEASIRRSQGPRGHYHAESWLICISSHSKLSAILAHLPACLAKETTLERAAF